MRVTLLGPVYPYRGGIAHYTTMLQRTLLEHGHTAPVVSFRRQYPPWLFPGVSDRDPSSQILRARDVSYAVDPLDPFTWLRACRLVRAQAPDLVVFPWWTTYWALVWRAMTSWLRRKLPVPVVFICHNVLPHEASPRDRWLTRLALRKGTHFVVQSDGERTRLLQLLPDARISTVPHPVYDMFAVGPSLARAEARSRLDLPGQAKVVLFFGLVREYKGLMDLLEAMPRVVREASDVLLVIAGEFWEERDLYLQRIARLGIESFVRIHDRYIPNEEVQAYFRAADVVVAPHRRATGSGVVQMAIGFGVPLVTTLGSHFEGLQIPRCLRIIPPSDSAALARELVSLLCMPNLESCEAEMSSLRDEFSWDRLVGPLERIAREAA